MGKGTGEEPPKKFIDDQYFCQFCIFLFIGFSLTFASLSAGMDDGGSFPYPYFLNGFVLALILLVNLLSRRFVVKAIKKKGITRNNILDILNETACGKHVWPWSCRVGIVWSIASCILTGLGGVNCMKEENNGTVSEVKNSCYYDVTTVQADVFKGMAIGLILVYVASFVYLLFSNCPAYSVLDKIKEDPAPRNTAPRANNPPALASGSNNTQAAPTSNTRNETEMQRKIEQLETTVRELEKRDRQQRELSVLPPPPSYNELMNPSNTGAHPDSSFPS